MQQVTAVSFCGCLQPVLWPVLPSSAGSLDPLSAPLRTHRSCRSPAHPMPRRCGAGHSAVSPASRGQLLLWTLSRERGFGEEARQERSPAGGSGVKDVLFALLLSCGASPSHLRTSPRAALPAARSGLHSLPGDSYVITPNPSSPPYCCTRFYISPVTDEMRGVPSPANLPTSEAEFKYKTTDRKLPVLCKALWLCGPVKTYPVSPNSSTRHNASVLLIHSNDVKMQSIQFNVLL